MRPTAGSAARLELFASDRCAGSGADGGAEPIGLADLADVEPDGWGQCDLLSCSPGAGGCGCGDPIL